MLYIAEVNRSKQQEPSACEKTLFGIERLSALRTTIPSTAHVDYSIRVRNVHLQFNPRYHQLITDLKELTHPSVPNNTFSNIRRGSIVYSPLDAFRRFTCAGIDVLDIGNAYLDKIQSLKLTTDNKKLLLD